MWCKNLKKARKSMGMTQEQVAEYLFVSTSYYRAIENGISNGSIDLWDKLEDLFHMHQRILRDKK